MNFFELNPHDEKYIHQIVELEKEAFGSNGGVDLWILKPMVRYGKVFVLVKEEEVVGVGEFIRDYDGDEVFLYGFAIKKNYRRMGNGERLLRKCIEKFKEDNIKKVSLSVDLKNESAIKLYEKLGFINKKLLKDEYGKDINRFYFVKKI